MKGITEPLPTWTASNRIFLPDLWCFGRKGAENQHGRDDFFLCSHDVKTLKSKTESQAHLNLSELLQAFKIEETTTPAGKWDAVAADKSSQSTNSSIFCLFPFCSLSR